MIKQGLLKTPSPLAGSGQIKEGRLKPKGRGHQTLRRECNHVFTQLTPKDLVFSSPIPVRKGMYCHTDYSSFKIPTALQTRGRREMAGRGWAVRPEKPDPFNCFKWLAVSLLPLDLAPPSRCGGCCLCLARTSHFKCPLSPPPS